MIDLTDYEKNWLYVITKWKSTSNVVVLPSDSKVIDNRLYRSEAITTQYFMNNVEMNFWGSPSEAESDRLSYEITRSCGEDDYFNLDLDDYMESLSTRKSEEFGREFYFGTEEANFRLKEIKKDYERMNEAARQEAIKKYHSEKETK